MIGVIVLLAGIAIGVFGTLGAVWPAVVDYHSRRPRTLPPATARQIDRAARRNRADLRHVLSARAQGVRVVETRPLVFREEPTRSERLNEPPNFDPFREEHTR